MNAQYAKNALMRALLGFPLGVMLGLIIVIGISHVLGTGEFHPAVPSLVASIGNELNAVTLQFALCGLLGSSFAACSVLFEVETKGILWQTVVHFLITSTVMCGIAYICHWMEHNLSGALVYIGIFVGLYVLIWAAQMFYWHRHVAAINKRLD